MNNKYFCDNSEIHFLSEDNIAESDHSSSSRTNLKFNTYKSYAPKRFKKFVSSCSTVIVSSIGVLAVLLFLSIFIYLRNPQIKDVVEKLDFSEKIIFSDANKIKVLDLKSKKTSTLLNVTNEIIALEVVNSTIFYIQANSSTLSSFPASTNDVTFSKLIQPKTFAVDTLTKKVYILDEFVGTITVIDMVHNYYGVVLSDLEDPHDIVIDIQHGVMFIVQHSKSILRANLDGTNLTTIAKDRSITKISLDRKRKKVFFLDEYTGITSIDYEGQNEVVFKNFDFPVMSLDIISDKLFWMPYPLLSSLKRNTLFFCSVDSENCENHETFSIYGESLKMFKGHVDLSSSDEMKNPCEINNGDCSDLCLLTSEKPTRSCACHLGLELNEDDKTCSPVTDFIIYTENNIVRAISVKNQATFKDIIIPKPFKVQFSRGKNAVIFDYDVRNDNFILSDGNIIHKMKIMDDSPQKYLTSFLYVTWHLSDISFDRLTNNLYYFAKRIPRFSFVEEGYISVMSNINSDTNYRKTILKTSRDEVYHLNVLSDFGYLLYTRNYSDKDIHTVTLNGTNTKSLFKFPNISTPNFTLALDYDEEEVYFVDEHKKFISHVDLDFKNEIKRSHTVPVKNMTSMSISKQYIYVSNQTSIWRLDKNNDENSIQIVPKYGTNSVKKISGVKVFSTSQILKKIDNPCAYKNGNCEQFCFSKPEKSCGCEDGKTLHNLYHCV